LRVRLNVHVGNAYSLECSHSGYLLFTGGKDGFIHMFDDKLLSRDHGNSKGKKESTCNVDPVIPARRFLFVCCRMFPHSTTVEYLSHS